MADRKEVKAGKSSREANAELHWPKSVDDKQFFEKLHGQLKSRQADKNVLVSIPIWGWTGDGKTCAMLTAIHYCDPSQHPLGLALVTNTDELVSLENATEEYRGLNLAGIASATTVRLRELSELFIDNNKWPPGTDEPASYVLAMRSIKETLGYVLFPDIKGGSFRELDQTAREVLRRAHAVLLLVNPEMYVKKSTDGKRYRDDILARVQEFASNKIPVCVMITKADRYKATTDIADQASNLLTMMLDQQPKLDQLLCRVSVVGVEHDLDGKDLPPADKRSPEHLLKACTWLLVQALTRSAPQIRKVLPSLNFQAIEGDGAPIKHSVVPELRPVGDFSAAPGRMLCATNDDPSSVAVTFVSDTGELLETVIDSAVTQKPEFRRVGTIPAWTKSDVQAHYKKGSLL
jgi:hypothetical protein